jgi:hypothetical protein
MAGESEAKFTVDLALKGGEQTRAEAANMEQLSASIASATQTTAKLQLAYRNLKFGGLQNSLAAKELKTRLDATKKSIGQNQLELLKIRGSLANASKETKAFSASTKTANSSLQGLVSGLRLGGGPLDEAAQKTGALVSALGKAGLAGAAVAAVAGVIALDAIIVKATISLARMAITSADAYRSERLELEGMTKAWVGWWFQVRAGKASDVQSAIDTVSQQVPLARAKIVELADSLYRSRLRGETLKQALLGVAMASSATGGKFEEAAKGLVTFNALMGKGAQMGQTLQSRFGGIVSKQMLSLSTQTAKAKENFAALFRGINIDPVLKGLHNVLGILDQGTVEFKAWKTILETLFNPLFGGAEEGGKVIEKFVDKATILSLQAALAWKHMKGSFSLKDIGLDSTAELLSKVVRGSTGFAIGLLQATKAAMVLMDVLVGLGGVLYNTTSLMASLLSAGRLGDKPTEALKGLRDSAKLALGGNSMSNAGFDMIDGLIGGIRKAQPLLNQAVIQAAHESNEAFRKAQDMHSPSRVWRGFGFNLGTSAAAGIHASIPRFEAATSMLANVPSAQPSVNNFGGANTRIGGDTHVQVGDIHIHGGQGQSGMVEIPIDQLRSFVASIFEGLAIQRGALPA